MARGGYNPEFAKNSKYFLKFEAKFDKNWTKIDTNF